MPCETIQYVCLLYDVVSVRPQTLKKRITWRGKL